MSDCEVLFDRVYLIPPRGLLEKAKRVILEKLNSGVLKYLSDIEIPCSRSMLVELVVDDECEICPVAVEIIGELIAKCDKVVSKIYNISYVKEPFNISATPTFRVNGRVTWIGVPTGDMSIFSDMLIEAYIRTHPDLEKLILKLKSFAEQYEFSRCPNETIYKKLLYKLLSNIDKYGYPYCPCRPLKVAATTQEILELNRDKICPCIYAVTDVKLKGRCLCGLFWSKSEIDKYISERSEKYKSIIAEIDSIGEDLRELKIRVITGGSKRFLEAVIRRLERLYFYLPED